MFVSECECTSATSYIGNSKRGFICVQQTTKHLGNSKSSVFEQVITKTVAYPGIFSGGVQQIHIRTEDRENGDLGMVAP
jgi:hypothetical protein